MEELIILCVNAHIMEDYVTLAMRTASHIKDGSVDNNILHAAIGIVGEVCGYRIATTFVNRHEELSDICWYIALFADALKFTIVFSTIEPNKDASTETLEAHAHSLLNNVKRAFAYNKTIPDSVYLDGLCHILADVKGLCRINFDKLLNSNIEKLRVRYPDKYSDICAEDRDLEAEYDLLADLICESHVV